MAKNAWIKGKSAGRTNKIGIGIAIGIGDEIKVSQHNAKRREQGAKRKNGIANLGYRKQQKRQGPRGQGFEGPNKPMAVKLAAGMQGKKQGV